ncbi:MAG: NmrA/HSCARG family protein [Gemmatimonadales bacterium]|nr:NmrA/HSCARG family protein [Gemmatimonadales bacterium]
MAGKKIIVVIGATGAQGGGLARAIAADSQGEFTARAVTRKLDSDPARALAAAGIEVVAADADNPATLDQAFAGAHGAFCVTNFWEHFSAEREQTQARNLAQAAQRAGVRHVVWSTLEDTRKWVPLADTRMPTLHGKYKVPHFDSKGEADEFFRSLGVPTTFLLTSFYWDNFIHFGLGPKRGPDGTLAITLPLDGAKLPGIAVADIGKCAYGVFKRGSELIGKTVGIAGGHPTGAEVAAGLTRALGETVRFQNVSPEVYRGFGFPGADDLGNMFQFKRDFNDYYCGARDLGFSRSLNPELQSYDTWLDRNKDRIPRG